MISKYNNQIIKSIGDGNGPSHHHKQFMTSPPGNQNETLP